jgi:flagellar assembly protein FliH
LAIARKILHREAQLDPLLLAAAVRVALEKISSATMIRLYVHPDHVQIWREFLDHQSDLREKPDVLGDATIVEGQCRIESSIGAADLSLEKQMTEIERGFFDLLAQRPDNP